MKTVRVIGVPEHFNLPWQLCIEHGEFSERGLNVQWRDIPEGTGKMCQMLRDHETDLAVILTEGILKDIANGNPSVLVQEYVSSPLQWGIFVGAKSPYQSVAALKDKKVAISRMGSGSQLMAIVNARQQGWSEESLTYEIVNTLDGAIEALTDGTADYFMWDRFMTQPVVNQGIFRRVGVCPTPWPSFIIAATKSFAEENTNVIHNLLEVLNTTTQEFKWIPSIDKTISQRYGQKLEDVAEWLQVTNWSQKNFNRSKFDKINQQLQDLNIIKEPLLFDEVLL